MQHGNAATTTLTSTRAFTDSDSMPWRALRLPLSAWPSRVGSELFLIISGVMVTAGSGVSASGGGDPPLDLEQLDVWRRSLATIVAAADSAACVAFAAALASNATVATLLGPPLATWVFIAVHRCFAFAARRAFVRSRSRAARSIVKAIADGCRTSGIQACGSIAQDRVVRTL